MKKLAIAAAALIAAGCMPVDRNESAKQFEALCGEQDSVDVTWHSSNGHISITCSVGSDQIKQFNER